MTLLRTLALLAMAAGMGQASTTDFWITQNGAGSANGSSLGNAAACDTTPNTPQTTCAAFNNGSNWGAGATQIGAGTTVHVSGTITAAANAVNYFSFQAGGTSGNPITFLMDSSTVITSPAWATGDFAIYSIGHSYITVNGGATGSATGGTFSGGGTIQATANGTGLAHQNLSAAIGAYTCSNCIFENMTISNIYVHTSTSDEGGDPTGAIYIDVGSNLTVTNNVAHDMKWCLEYNYGTSDSNVTFSDNLVYNVDHGVAVGGGSANIQVTGLYVFGNYYHDPANWDDAGNNNHHDGVHIWANSGGSEIVQNSFVYNNYFYGNFGTNMNSAIYQEGVGFYNASCNAWIFNNVVSPSAGVPSGNGLLGIGANGGVGCWTAANNTVVGYSTSDGEGLNFNGTAGAAYSNIISTVNSALGVTAAPGAIDYNDYYNLGSGGMTGGGASLATWVSFCLATYTSTIGCDAHAISGNPNLTSGFVPNSGSPVIAAGKNLYSTCNGQANPGLGALCFDAAGKARPSSGGWDIGAYQFAAAAYYISTTGSDSNPGTLAQPFLTLTKAQTAMQSGAKTTYIRVGTYMLSASLTFTSSDNGESWQNYPGEVPVIDGASGGVPTTGYNFTLISPSNMTFQGLTFQNMTGVASMYGAGDFVGSSWSNITWNLDTFLNCAYECIMASTAFSSTITNDTFNGLTGADGGPFTDTYAVFLLGNPTGLVQHNNFINLTGGAVYAEAPSSFVVNLNCLLNVNTGPFTTGDIGAIYMVDTAHTAMGNAITNNVIINNGPGLPNAFGVAAIYLDDEMSYATVTGNICQHCGNIGQLIHGGDHNAIENNIWDLSGGAELLFYQQDFGHPDYGMAGNVWQQNLVYTTGTATSSTLWNNQKTMTDANPTVQNNIYYAVGGGTWPNSGASPADGIVDTSPVYQNPLFTNPSAYNYAMPGTSPAFTVLSPPFTALPTNQGPTGGSNACAVSPSVLLNGVIGLGVSIQ